MKTNAARRPRFKRVADFPPVRLTERDKLILSSLSRHRFLTTGHIISLAEGSGQNVSRRLQRLYHAGLVDRPKAQLAFRHTQGHRETIHCITKKGAAAIGLAQERRPVSGLFLLHALAVSGFLVSVELASRSDPSFQLIREEQLANGCGAKKGRIEWRVTIKGGGRQERIGIAPDGAFALEFEKAGRTARRHFFVEADRGTMPVRRKGLRLSSLYRKLLGYSETRRLHTLREMFGIGGFHALFVMKSTARLKRAQEACRGLAPQPFLFVTERELQGCNCVSDCVWHTPQGDAVRLL